MFCHFRFLGIKPYDICHVVKGINSVGDLPEKHTPERAESIDYSTYAEGTERYWIYTREEHADLADGDLKQMNGCRIGATDGSYQKELLEKWLDSNQI